MPQVIRSQRLLLIDMAQRGRTTFLDHLTFLVARHSERFFKYQAPASTRRALGEVQGVEFCLKMPSPLRSINETKQNLQFSRQFSLGNVKLWARVLSCERHTVTIEDAHLAPPFHG
jgi:hypothetical protein